MTARSRAREISSNLYRRFRFLAVQTAPELPNNVCMVVVVSCLLWDAAELGDRESQGCGEEALPYNE